MPKVPTYESPTVGAEVLQPVDIQPFKSADNAGQDAQLIGKGMLAAGTGVTKLMLRQQKLDDEAAYNEKVGKLNEWEMQWQSENQDRKMQKANGMTNEYFTAHSEMMETLAQELPSSVADKFRYKMKNEGIAQAKRWSVYEAGQKHEYRQSANNVSIKSYTNKAINLPDQGPDWVDAMAELKNLVDQGLDLKGVTDPKIKEAAWKAAQADVYVGRTRALLDKDPVQAYGYWQGVRHFVEDAKTRQDYDEKLKLASEDNEAETWVESQFKNPENRATLEQSIIDRYEGKQETAALTTLKRLMNADANNKEIVKNTNVKTAWDLVNKPENVSRKLDAIPETQKMWLRENAATEWNALVKWSTFADIKTDEDIHGDLLELRDNRPADFKQLQLDQFRGVLSNTDLQSLREDQNTIDSKMQTTTRSQQISAVFEQMGWGGKGDKKKQHAFRRAFDLAEKEFMSSNGGKPPNQEQRQLIIDRLLMDGEVVSGSWYIPDFDKKFYETVGTEDAAKFRFDIPDAERELIKQALKQKGQVPSEENIQRLFLLKKVSK